ncbi:MAG TPA: uL15 family ribosomal protein, partial [Xylella taiwanensis]
GGQTPMQRRLPKIGFRSRSVASTAEVLSYKLGNLEPGEIDFSFLRLAKLVPSTAKKAKIVKKGILTKAFVLKGVATTAGARVVIETAGGSFQE